MQENLNKVMKWFEQLSPETLTEMRQLYSEPTYFKDPFHEMHSVENELTPYFSKMFTGIQDARFEFIQSVLQGSDAFLVWNMKFKVKGRDFQIHGSSHLKFNEEGLVSYHRDYWDPVEEVYDKIPGVGLLTKGLKKIFKSL